MSDYLLGLLNSGDYKERMLGEYLFVKEKYDKLHKMLVKHSAGTLDFTPTCELGLLREQEYNMRKYLDCLEIRMEVEKVER